MHDEFKITQDDFLDTYKLRKFGHYALASLSWLFPIRPNVNLAKIVSCLTFDGHLSVKKSMFYFSSGNKEELKEFEEIVFSEFNKESRIVPVTTGFGVSYKCLIISKPLGRILSLLGAPSGDKIKTPFLVPSWISKNKGFARSYLRVAFDCEGGFWKEPGRVRIRFRLCKSEELLKNGLEFMDDLKRMLSDFGVRTTRTHIRNENLRKDGIKTKAMWFDIVQKDVELFNKEIGSNIKRKKILLDGVVRGGAKSAKS